MTDDSVRDNWVIDSRCTYQMTSRRDWFVEFQEKGSSQIILGDFHTVEILGTCSIKLNTHGGSVKIMHNII